MIEEIKVEIEEAGIYVDGIKITSVEEWNNVVNELIHYKTMWEELKLIINAFEFDKVRTIMRELEQENGIGGE